MPMPASIHMATDSPHSHGFWSAVRDVVRCNRKDGKRWQCAREVVPGQKYCERHVGRGRNRLKRSAEGYSATSDVPATPSLGAISSVSMAAAAHVAVSEVAYGDSQLLSTSPILQPSHITHESGRAALPRGFEKIARVKNLYDRVRSNFPYFDAVVGKSYPTFMENAGGSQCPRVVIDAISNYMKTCYAQVGAGHEVSNRADEVVKSAHDHMKTFTNAHGVGEVVLGPSTSQLITTLSYSYNNILREGDEVIIHEANHEANLAPWERTAAKRGISVKWWRINYDTFESDLNDLACLLSPRTRIVAVPHVSNVLGEVLDLERIVKVVKSRIYDLPVRVVADGVSFAPHRSVDVEKWGVDWYVFSSYKVYGPHMAVLFGTHEAFMDLKDDGPNWDFIHSGGVVNQFELGGVSHEACAGVVALTHYLGVLARIGESFSSPSEGRKQRLQLAAGSQADGGSFSLDDRVDHATAYMACGDDSLKGLGGTGTMDLQPLPEAVVDNTIPSLRDWEFALQGTSFGQDVMASGGTVSTRLDRVVVEAAFDTVMLLEQPLQEKLLAFLSLRPDVLIIGPKSAAFESRVPTISFIHVSKSSSDICRALQAAGFAVRNGYMYAYRLVSVLAARKKLTVNSIEDGVVRISMVHYNTPIEVARLIVCLQAIL